MAEQASVGVGESSKGGKCIAAQDGKRTIGHPVVTCQGWQGAGTETAAATIATYCSAKKQATFFVLVSLPRLFFPF